MLERKYEEERNEYRRLKEKFKKEAQNLSQMYLISKSWLEKWKKVSGYNKQKRNDKWKNNKDLSSNLGAIDNSVLLINTTECKPVYKFKENEIFIENYNERKEESKYINKLDNEKELKRIVNRFVRMGYSYHDIKAALREFDVDF